MKTVKLNKVEAGGDLLNAEKTKIKMQFRVFMLAYLTTALFYIFEWQCMDAIPSAVKFGKYVVIIFESILPISYVIKVHSSAYSKMA